MLFGDPPKVGPYLADLHARGLAILMVVGPPRSDLDEASRAFLELPGHPFAVIDEIACLGGDDLSGIVDRIRRWSGRYRIKGLFGASEVFSEVAGVVADAFGLPGVGLRAARVCRDKLLQRQYLAEWSPESRLVTRASRREAARWCAPRLPVVVKPLHLSSSIGVRRFDDEADLAAHLAGLGPGDELLVEPRVQGREFNVDIVTAGGRPVFSAVTQKGTNEGATPYFAELIHTFPAVDLTEAERGRLLETATEVVRRLDFATGWAHAEYRVGDDGEARLMEIAARPPGDGCMALFHLATGRALEPLLIDAALGRQDVIYPEPRRRTRQIYFEPPPGSLRSVTVDWPGTVPNWLVDSGIWPEPRPCRRDGPPTLHEVMIQKERGAVLRQITESGHRAVTALFDTPLDADIDSVEARVRAAVGIDSVQPSPSEAPM
ncbi:hypothetical protein GCM10010468_20090 [Actinocorallia longicatena]|uniref:ATP-grasp domain-containing protein n=1 Tax=Actinocorallia longicatena TaxID=111803 RepID=A0ABP6Q563_9ACTN